MKFTETHLQGAYIIDQTAYVDDRGFFADLFCQQALLARGLCAHFVQAKNSLSKETGTLRGLHYQLAPRQQDKLVRCISGRVWDVLLDLRCHLPSFGQWFGVELSAQNRRMLYVPKGCAHAFLTLEPNSELLYFVTDVYAPELERGIRWDDPCHGIEWPIKPHVLSKQDSAFANYSPEHHLGLHRVSMAKRPSLN